MKYITLLAILTIAITGCSFGKNDTFSIDDISQCVSENTLEICKSKCNGDMTCEQRVDVIAEENTKTTKQENTEAINQDTDEIEKLGNEEIKDENVDSKDKTAKQPVTEKTEEQTTQNGLVTLSGSSCDNKEDLPETMKIFAERVDIKKWDWIVSRGGEWELTDMEPGQYKIYYAPERSTEPLGKYSEFIADGNGNHDYKILDLTNGGEVRNINPCDWE